MGVVGEWRHICGCRCLRRCDWEEFLGGLFLVVKLFLKFPNILGDIVSK